MERVTVFCAAKNGGSEARSDARVTDFFAKQKNRNERNKTKNQSKDAQQLLIGEEEQGSVRMLLFLCPKHKNKTEQSGLCSDDVVPMTGLEPVRCCHRGILSPLRLPISPHRHGTAAPLL